MLGVAIGPPKQLIAENPTSSKTTYTMLGAPSGARGGSNGDQSSTESRMSTLTVPLNCLFTLELPLFEPRFVSVESCGTRPPVLHLVALARGARAPNRPQHAASESELRRSRARPRPSEGDLPTAVNGSWLHRATVLHRLPSTAGSVDGSPVTQIRGRRRPGVTAAATTAVLATGAGPGVTALATTAVFATGCPTTPTRPTLAALSGMSGSCCLECRVSLDCGDDGLDGDPPVGDQLSAGTARGRGERRGPDVLVDDHAGRAAGVHRRSQVLDVVLGEQFGQLCLKGP